MHTREALAIETGRVEVKQTTRAVAGALRAGMGQGRMPFLEVTSNSMAPLLQRGDQVGLAAARPEQLQQGDVVTFVDGAHLTTHRYWGRAGDRLQSRGDRTGAFDQPWQPDALVGRVVVRRRRGASFWLDLGLGRRLNRFLYRLSLMGQQLHTRGLPGRLVRAGWLVLALPAVGAGSALAARSREKQP